jgi:hypothetical protein
MLEEHSYYILIWEFAIEKNCGMDVDLCDDYNEETEKYIKMYIEEVYKHNMEGISLL